MSSANSDSFTSSFLILLPLLYFSCLVALARFSRTILNKSGDSGLPNLVPNLREKAFSVSAPSLKLVVGLSYMTFIMMMFILSIPSLLLRVFYHERMLKFVKCFFCVYWENLNWVVDTEQSLLPWNKPHLIMVYDPFKVQLDLVC